MAENDVFLDRSNIRLLQQFAQLKPEMQLCTFTMKIFITASTLQTRGLLGIGVKGGVNGKGN